MHPYKFYLSFRVFHPRESVARINKVVGLKPRVQNDVGVRRATPKGHLLDGTYDRTYCSYKLKDGMNSSLLACLSSWNLYFARRKLGLKKLSRSGGKLEYFLGLYIKSNGGLELDPKLIADAGRLGITFALDIYTGSAVD
jgi:hypothetical protein